MNTTIYKQVERTRPIVLNIAIEDDAVLPDIKKAIRMIRGVCSVRQVRDISHSVTPALQKKIAKAEEDMLAGRCIACDTKEELNAFLEAL